MSLLHYNIRLRQVIWDKVTSVSVFCLLNCFVRLFQHKLELVKRLILILPKVHSV